MVLELLMVPPAKLRIVPLGLLVMVPELVIVPELVRVLELISVYPEGIVNVIPVGIETVAETPGNMSNVVMFDG